MRCAGRTVWELPVSEALMSAAQNHFRKSTPGTTSSGECEAALACGYPYGFGVNLTVFTGVSRRTPLNTPWDNRITSPRPF